MTRGVLSTHLDIEDMFSQWSVQLYPAAGVLCTVQLCQHRLFAAPAAAAPLAPDQPSSHAWFVSFSSLLITQSICCTVQPGLQSKPEDTRRWTVRATCDPARQ